MLPLVLETGVFSHDGVYSIKNQGKTGVFFSKSLQQDKLATCRLTSVLNAGFYKKPASYSLKLPALVCAVCK